MMHTRRNRQIIAIVFLLSAAVPMAFAHAILVRSTPADQSVVHSRTVNLTLDFNSRIDAGRSTLTLTGPGGKTVPVEMESSAKPYQLKGAAANLVVGSYQIHWQVLASDGHITRGDVAFTVAAK